MDKNAKIYIAGHTGLTGSAVVRKLLREGYTNLLLRRRGELNLFDQKAVESFFRENHPEYVVLCAARVGGIGDNTTHPADFLYENLLIQNNIIWSAHQYSPKKLIFLGSSCIYPRDAVQPMREDVLLTGKPEPTNEAYAIAKIAGMMLCQKLVEQYGDNFISCIPSNLYGPNDHFNDTSGHVIPALIKRIHEAKVNNSSEVIIWGSGNVKREFLYIDDFADAIYWLLSKYAGKEALNIGTGEDITVRDLAHKIKSIIGYEGELSFDTSKPDGMPRKLLDISKANSLGWEYTTRLDKGLQQTYEWFVLESKKK